MLFEGDNPKGVLSPSRFSELLTAKMIEFPKVTVEEIEDRSKGDGFSKTIVVRRAVYCEKISASRSHSRRATNPFIGCS